MKEAKGGINTVIMTKGSPLRHVVCFALPLMIGNAFQQVYILTDTAVVGRVLGVVALSALGACDLLIWTLFSSIQAFTEGFSIKLAARFGADDSDGFNRTLVTGAFLSIIEILVMLPLIQLAIPLILSVMRVRPEIYPHALLYLRIICAGIPFVTAYNFCFAILRALGNSKIPLYVMSMSAMLNIVLDVVFVTVFKWGIGSVAFATVMSQFFSAVYSLVTVRKLVRDAFESSRFDKACSQSIMRLSIPMAGEIVIGSIGGLVVQSVVNCNAVAFIAGYTATYKLYGLLEVAAIAYGFAVTTYTSQNYGAGEQKRIKKGLLVSEGVAVITSLVFTMLIFLFGRSVISLFISGSAEEIAVAIPVGLKYLRIMGITLPMLYTVHVMRAFVQGLGHAGLAIVTSVVELIARVLVVTVFATILGAECVLFAESAAWCTGASFLTVGAMILMNSLVRSTASISVK